MRNYIDEYYNGDEAKSIICEATEEITVLRQRVAELEMSLAETEALELSHGERIEKLTAERDALKQQRDELLAALNWHPIETAPKDTFVLLAGPSGYTTIETVFATGRMCSDYHKGRWIDHANDDLTDWGFEPTHWTPLPPAPPIATVKEK